MERHGILDFKKILKNKEEKKEKDPRLMIYLITFLFTLHLTPASYVNSTFISQFTGAKFVGYIYAFSSLLTIFAFIVVKRILQYKGNYKTFYTNLLINIVCLIILSTSLIVNINIIWKIIFISTFIIAEITRNISFLNLDIFLEHYSKNKETGSIRGIFLTALNLAFVIGPFITSLIVTDVAHAARVYLWGALVTIPLLFIAHKSLKNFEDNTYEKSDMWKTAKLVWKNKNLYRIFMANSLLRFFYAWMIIYTPIYLTQYMGLTLADVGIIMSIALLPFIILEIPLGRIADDLYGEKEMLTLGFLITGVSTISMFFIQTNVIWVWATILFFTRIGASMIEIMTETYLFKKIDDDDINVLGLYRAVRPFAYIKGPTTASILLIFLPMPYLFIILGIIMIFGIKYSLMLQDTR